MSEEGKSPDGGLFRVILDIAFGQIAFLQQMLTDRDFHWKKEAERLREENQRLTKSDTRQKVAIAEMCQYIIGLELAWEKHYDFYISESSDFSRWWDLVGWEEK